MSNSNISTNEKLKFVSGLGSSNGKLSFVSKLAYGFGEVPGAVNGLLGAFLMMFYTDKVGLSAGVIGTMFLISKIFDGTTDLIAGTIVDKTKTKWGKARPWLLWGAVPTGLSVALIFMVPNSSPTVKLIYAFITYNLFTSIMYTMVGVAKSALMALMTQNPMQRGNLAIFSLIFGLGGSVLGFSVTMPFIFKLGGDINAWRIVFAIYGIIATISLLISFLCTKETVTVAKASSVEESMTFLEGVKNFFQNKYFILALGVTVAVSLGLALNSGAQMYFYTYVMKDPMLMTSLSMTGLIPTIISIVFLAAPSLRFFGKKGSVYVGATVMVLAYVLRGLAVSSQNMTLLIVGTILGGIAVGPMSVPINTFSADAVDYGEYKTGKRIEGIGSSVVTFSQKVSNGLAGACIGWVLALSGYVANNPEQTAATKTALVWLFAYGPAILTVVVILLVKFFYNYDKEHEMVVQELDRRRNMKAE